MINKAQIEIPPRFAIAAGESARPRADGSGEGWKGAAGLAADVRYYGEWMRERAWERIGHLYPKYNGETVIAWLWARTVTCPNPACGAQVPMVRSFWLSKKGGKKFWLKPLTAEHSNSIYFEIATGEPSSVQSKTIEAGTAAVTDKGN